jgi:hypothetical protein
MNLSSASAIINPNTERLFQKKPTSFQYVSINATRWLNIGLFQGMIWQTGDNRNRQKLDWQYFDPIIYTNLWRFGLDNKNNVLAGADFKIKPTTKMNIYGQGMLDGMKNGASGGFQGGIRFFDLFNVKDWWLQFEYNMVDRHSYGDPDSSGSDQSYTHYNQNLAFTPNNGKEFITMTGYSKNRFFVDARVHLQEHSAAGGSFTGIINARIGYLINPSYNLNVCAGMTLRKQNFYNFKTLENNTTYLYLGLRTSIYNLYYDF